MKISASYLFLLMVVLQFQASAGINKRLYDPGEVKTLIQPLDTPQVKNDDSRSLSSKAGRKMKGYSGIVEVNYGSGVGKINLPEYAFTENYVQVESFGFRWVNGYRVDEHLTFGLSLGIDGYSQLRSEMYTFYLPIAIDTRFELIKNDFSPVINFNGGYAAGISGMKGGTLINPSFGFRYYVSGNAAILFNVGYKWQTLVLWDPDPTAAYYPIGLYRNVTSKFITFNFGFSF